MIRAAQRPSARLWSLRFDAATAITQDRGVVRLQRIAVDTSNPPVWSPRHLTVLLGVALVLGFLYLAQVVVIPVALAILFTFLLAPLVSLLQRWRLGRVPSVVLVTVLALGAVSGLAWAVTHQIGSLLDAYPKYEQNVASKIASMRMRGGGGLIDKMQAVTERIGDQLEVIDVDNAMPPDPELARAQPVRIVAEADSPLGMADLWSVAAPLLEPLAGIGLVVVLVVFMLIHREDLRDRVIALIGTVQMAETTRALDDAGGRVSRYLVMQLAINVGYGVAVALGLWAIGVPYAVLWGFFAALLRYIPYLGPWLAAMLPITMSVLIEPSWSTALLVVGLFGALELVTNMIIEPTVYGRGIGVSQAALLIAVAFWTWLWGAVGLVLASPLTVCLVVLGRHVPHLRFLDTLLGDKPALSPAHRFYQRMLAEDEIEAAGLLADVSALDGQDRGYDDVVVPMLAQSRLDVREGRISPDIHARLVLDTRQLVDAHRRQIRPDAMVGAELTPVLAIASRDSLDEVAVSMLGKLVDPGRIDWQAASSLALASDVVAAVREADVGVVVLMSLPPGGLAHARYLCKRLRTHVPGLHIIVVRPGLYEKDRDAQWDALREAGANRVAATLADAVSELNKAAMLDNVAELPTAPDAPDAPLEIADARS